MPFSARDGQVFTSSRAPTENECMAMSTTLRFFIQDNEPTSVRNMAELYERLTVLYGDLAHSHKEAEFKKWMRRRAVSRQRAARTPRIEKADEVGVTGRWRLPP